MTERENLLTSIAGTIKDYRGGEFAVHPVAKHVDQWIAQFDLEVQVPMLRELNHVFQRTYVPQFAMREFLTYIADGPSLEFWQSVHICNIQKLGRSQSEIKSLFDVILAQKYGHSIEHRESTDGDLVYFDDAVFTGDHVIRDLKEIIEKISKKIQLYIIVFASHTSAEHRIKTTFTRINNRINVNVHSKWRFENRKTWHKTWHKTTNELVPTDVLRPSEIGKRDHSARTSPFFSCVEGRELLEEQFLKAGEKIRGFAANPDPNLKPLGYSNLEPGFGSLFVTYRNCPNNCPLALWYGDPSHQASNPFHPFSRWYPLFLRRTNRQ